MITKGPTTIEPDQRGSSPCPVRWLDNGTAARVFPVPDAVFDSERQQAATVPERRQINRLQIYLVASTLASLLDRVFRRLHPSAPVDSC